MMRPITVTDKYHNALTMRSLIKPVEAGPFRDCLGEVRGIYKDQLFIWFFKSPNPQILRESNGFRAFKTHQVVNAGHEHLSAS